MKNSEFKDDIENVEKILLSFPERCRINFYDNLNTLEIKFNQDSKDSILGNYNPLENIITLLPCSLNLSNKFFNFLVGVLSI